MKRSKIPGVLALLGVLGAAGAFYIGLLRLNYPSKKRFPIRGVDVSHHEGDIHWFEASLNGVQFAYLKATEGGDFKDRRFLYNWTQCGYNGIARGAYHYFSFCRPGAEQARNFLSALPGPPELPPALDLEFSGNCGRVPSRADLAREISAFVAVLSRRFAGPPVFYVSEEFYKRYLEGHRQEYPAHRLWIQNVVREPSQAPCGEWVFWQYAHRGRVPGIPGLVDLNVFCGRADEFSQFTRSPTKIELRRAGFAGIVRSSHE